MQTDRKEVLRYLGLGKHEPDPETERLLEECIREAERAAEFRNHRWRLLPDKERKLKKEPVRL